MESLKYLPIRVAVRAILINDDNKVLLTKRAPETFEEEKWCLVGGKPDGGEDLESCIIRETLEEVDVTFTPTSYFGEIENPDTSTGYRWITHYFTGKIDTLPNNLAEREISEVGFFSLSQLQEIDIAFDHRDVLTEYFEAEDRKKFLT